MFAFPMIPRAFPTKLRLGLLCVLLILVGMVFFAARTVWSFRNTSFWVLHTHEVRADLASVLSHLTDVETGVRGYLLTGDLAFLEPDTAGRDALHSLLPGLRESLADNPAQLAAFDALVPIITQRLAIADESVALRRVAGAEVAAAFVAANAGRNLMDNIRARLAAMNDTESRLLAERLSRARRDAHLALSVLIGGLLFSAGLLVTIVLILIRDFHTRERAAAELRRQADEIYDLYNNAPCGYHSLDANGYITVINDTELAWLGYTREEVVGRLRLPDLLTPASRAVFESSFPRFLAEGEVKDREYEMVRKDGTTFHVLLNASSVRDASGRPVAGRATLFDITERKRSEQLVHQARDFADSIVDTVREPLVILTSDLVVQRVNRAYHLLFKTTDAEVVGRPLIQLGAGEWARPDLLARLRQTVPDQLAFEALEVEINFVSIGRRFFSLGARKLYRPGNHTSLLLLAIEDVGAARRVERMHLEFRSLFESLPGLFLVLTRDLVIAAVSDAYLRATHTTRADIVGRPLFEVFPDNPDDTSADGVANLRASLSRVLRQLAPDTMPIQKYDVRRPDGVFEERYWSPVNSPIIGLDGNIDYIIHRAEDVTDFVRQKSRSAAPAADPAADPSLAARLQGMEAEVYQRSRDLQLALAQLRAANDGLEAFSYSVSHDLRAPLRHIEGFSGMLEKHAAAALDERGRRYLTVIADSARRMGVLIDDLLTFARIGRAELRRLPVQLDELVRDVRLSLVTATAGREIEWDIQPLPVVHADPSLLRQVLVNLLGNAVKYTGRRPSARIIIRCEPALALPGEVVVSVRDNGAGFDMKYAAKLFGVFQRLHNATEFEGTGVGLANVRRIIQRHGGRTWAEAVPDQGAVFFFSLPHESAPPPSLA